MCAKPIQSISLYIDGEFKPARSRQTFDTIDPASEAPLAHVAAATREDVRDAVASARQAFDRGEWPTLPAARRSQLLYEVAALIEARTAEIAETETKDTGMTLNMTRNGHVPRSVAHFRHFAEEAERNRSESYPLDNAYFYLVDRAPVGVVSVFAPWNAPLAVASIHLAAALAFGNCCVLKPSEYSPVSAHILAGIVEEAGIPHGVVNIVHGGEDTGKALAEHPDVNMIAFVGGTETGQAVMRAASGHLARLIMELGGKSPAIVFSDADFEKAVDGVALAAFSSNGEVCTAASRVLIERPIYERFVEALSARAKRIKIGDPLAAETEMGPLISTEHRSIIAEKVRSAVKSGAVIHAGGHCKEDVGKGYYFPPTILSDVASDSPIVQDEVFGPVTIAFPFDSEQEAISLANETRYGLAAYIWSADSERALRVSRRIRAGTIAINSVVIRDVRVPFGGFAQSGMGRAGGTYSRDAFTEVRATCIPVEPYPLPRLGTGNT